MTFELVPFKMADPIEQSLMISHKTQMALSEKVGFELVV